MNNNDGIVPDEEPKYQVYPSIEKAIDNLRYRQRLIGEDTKPFYKKNSKNPTSTKKHVSKSAKKTIDKKTPDTSARRSIIATADIVTSDSFNFPTAEPSIQHPSKQIETRPKVEKTGFKEVKIVKPQKEAIAHKNPLNDKEQQELHDLIVNAKEEEKSDSLGRFRSAPTLSRKKLIDKFMSLYRRGIKLNEKQLKYVKNFLYWHPEAIEPKYIRFLIPATVDIMGYTAAITTANELANILEDSKYEPPLREYSKYLIKKAKITKIIEMKNSGMENSQIGEKLGLSSAEVAILSENTEVFVFRDEDVR